MAVPKKKKSLMRTKLRYNKNNILFFKNRSIIIEPSRINIIWKQKIKFKLKKII